MKILYIIIKKYIKRFRNVEFLNTNDNFTIYSDKATYLKNDEIVFTEGNSRP